MAKSEDFTLKFLLVAIAGLSLVTLVSSASVAQSSAEEKLPDPESWNSSTEIEFDEESMSFITKLITGIIAFVIAVVAICLVLCFCCPICIIAKMRQRRGVVIRTAGPAVVNGQTVTLNVTRSAAPASNYASPPVVAIPNNLNAGNKPYPVQESVTVVPLLQPQSTPVQYPPNPVSVNYPNGPGPQFPQNFELPPPYPGLPRESDTSNLPYNPYFAGEGGGPSAPPPK